MPLLTSKKATSRTPQVVTLVVDDSDSMQGLADGGKSKAQVATESIQDMVITTQANTQGSKGFRFLLNIAKFGDGAIPIAEAKVPGDVDLDKLVFRGDSGWTNMASALDWAVSAVEKALEVCRAQPSYDESACPPPLVVFLSDGENTGPEIEDVSQKLRSIPFRDGKISVIACGIGMQPEHFAVMKAVASNPELAVNIKPSRLAEFIAAVGATMMHGDKNQIAVFKDEWDGQMAVGRAAIQERRFADAEAAFTAALNQVKGAGDHRLAATLTSLATLHTAQGEWAKGLPVVKESLDLLATLGPSTELAPGLGAAVGLAELVQIAGQSEEAKGIWKRIVSIWDSPAAAGVPGGNGRQVAQAFNDWNDDRIPEAQAAFEKVNAPGGLGSAASLLALAEINEESNGRAAAEPFRERLAAELAGRFGAAHPLARKVIADLRVSYSLGGRNDKIAELSRLYPAR
jgi:uncharacterized protein YegL